MASQNVQNITVNFLHHDHFEEVHSDYSTNFKQTPFLIILIPYISRLLLSSGGPEYFSFLAAEVAGAGGEGIVPGRTAWGHDPSRTTCGRSRSLSEGECSSRLIGRTAGGEHASSSACSKDTASRGRGSGLSSKETVAGSAWLLTKHHRLLGRSGPEHVAVRRSRRSGTEDKNS